MADQGPGWLHGVLSKLVLVRGSETLPARPVAPAQPVPAADDEPAEDQPGETKTPTEQLAKWLASGFGLLTGLLTFFGLTEGRLGEALTLYPYVALLVFFLVLGAVVATAAAAAVSTTAKVRVAFVVLVVTVLVLVCWWQFPDLEVHGWSWWILVIGVGAALVAIGLSWQWPLGAAAAVIMVATTALSLGLYGGAKIGVLAADFAVGVEVDAVVSRDPADAATAEVKLTVSAAGLDDDQVLRVIVLDARHASGAERPGPIAGENWLAVGYAVPDLGGSLQRTMTFRIPAGMEQAVAVASRCRLDTTASETTARTAASATTAPPVSNDTPDTSTTTAPATGGQLPDQDRLACPADVGEVFTRFAVRAGTAPTQRPAPYVAASITASEPTGPATATVTGLSRADATVEITITRDDVQVARSSLRAAADGTFTWSAPVQVVAGETIELHATMTPDADEPGTPPSAVATYTAAPPTTTTTTEP